MGMKPHKQNSRAARERRRESAEARRAETLKQKRAKQKKLNHALDLVDG